MNEIKSQNRQVNNRREGKNSIKEDSTTEECNERELNRGEAPVHTCREAVTVEMKRGFLEDAGDEKEDILSRAIGHARRNENDGQHNHLCSQEQISLEVA